MQCHSAVTCNVVQNEQNMKPVQNEQSMKPVLNEQNMKPVQNEQKYGTCANCTGFIFAHFTRLYSFKQKLLLSTYRTD